MYIYVCVCVCVCVTESLYCTAESNNIVRPLYLNKKSSKGKFLKIYFLLISRFQLSIGLIILFPVIIRILYLNIPKSSFLGEGREKF